MDKTCLFVQLPVTIMLVDGVLIPSVIFAHVNIFFIFMQAIYLSSDGLAPDPSHSNSS